MPNQSNPFPTIEPPALVPGGRRFCHGLVWAVALIGMFIGVSSIAIWLWPPARSALLWPGSMAMRMNTALAITSAAASLGLWQMVGHRPWAKFLAIAFGLVAALIGGLTALQDLAGLDLHLDTLLAPGSFDGDFAARLVVHPGRMSLNASTALAFLGLALATLHWNLPRSGGRFFSPAPMLALFAALPAVCGLIGYLLNASQFTGLLRSTTVLLHTAASLFLLSIGVLAARPERPPVSRILSRGAAGVFLRWMLPGSTVLLLALGWAISQGRRAGLVAPGEGTALMLYGGLILLSILLIAASQAVSGLEANAQTANAARRGEQERNRAIVDTALDGVLIMDAHGLVLDWNPAAERMFGWSREEILGRSLADHIIPVGLRQAHHHGLLKYLHSGETRILGRRLELPALRRDGTEFPAELSINVLGDAGHPMFVGFIRDITERRQAEDALRESEHRFRALADNISQFAWITDETGRVLWFNRRWYEFTGIAPEDVGSARRQKVLHPEHKERVLKKFNACLKHGDPWEDVFPLLGANGDYRWFLSRANPIRDASGQILRWFGTNTDVTEQRELSEALARAKEHAEGASQAKDNFLAALSHELRTPLTPALMTAAALRHDPRLPDDLRADAAMIERSIALESRLIDDLLDLTRISRGKLPLRTERCDVHSLLGHAIEIIRDEAQTKRIALEVQLKARLPGLKGDSARLQQVFWNLLKNAVKFTPMGGRIAIRTHNKDGALVLDVCDSGIGFSPAAADRLFQPFEQGDLEHTHRFGGLGLGLAIARAVVDLHGGQIQAHSDGPDRGATFTVEFPGATEPPAGLTLEHSGGEGAPPATHTLHILLVEDHEPTLAVLTRLLTRAGHTVFPCNSIASALATAATNRFTAVVSDLGLPDGTGHQLMTQLRAERPELRGIALSGYGMEEDLQRSREAGFVRHLVKPVDFDQLARALQETWETVT